MTWEEVVGIVVAVIILCLLVFLFVMYRRFRVKRSRERANNINNETRKDIMLNSTRPNDNEFKRGSKLSNLEVSQVYSTVIILHVSVMFLIKLELYL